MNTLRRTFGIGEPVRRGMELKIVRAGEWRPAALGASATVSSDILAGRDTEITWEDVYSGTIFFFFCPQFFFPPPREWVFWGGVIVVAASADFTLGLRLNFG